MTMETVEENEAMSPRYSIVPIWLWTLGAIAFLVMLGVSVEGYLAAVNSESLGQWGDFFGGTLNPFLSFFAFVGLLYTILLQRQELALSRVELGLTRVELKRSSDALESQNENLRKQGFESTFFGMVGVLNQIIESMDIEIKRGQNVYSFQSRDCFVKFVDQIREIYINRSWNSDPVRVQDPNKPWEAGELIDYPHDEDRILETYKYFSRLSPRHTFDTSRAIV